MEQRDKRACCICGKELDRNRYNPFPIRTDGECCRACNWEFVVPARIRRHLAYQRGEADGDRKVYISGAIAHHDLEERRAAFGRAESLLRGEGYEPVNPFKNGLPADAHWRAHMRADIGLLLGCDYIYMLSGWELSKGAKLELDVASSCGIEVMFEPR